MLAKRIAKSIAEIYPVDIHSSNNRSLFYTQFQHDTLFKKSLKLLKEERNFLES